MAVSVNWGLGFFLMGFGLISYRDLKPRQGTPFKGRPRAPLKGFGVPFRLVQERLRVDMNIKVLEPGQLEPSQTNSDCWGA